jgi:hypothetical protein
MATMSKMLVMSICLVDAFHPSASVKCGQQTITRNGALQDLLLIRSFIVRHLFLRVIVLPYGMLNRLR